MGYVVGSKGDGSVYVFCAQMRVVLGDLFHVHARAEFLQDLLHGHTCPTNHRLTEHDMWIDLNAFMSFHVILALLC